MRHDIRLLGRLLGEVIAECEGKRVFDTIETLRRTAVKFRREGRQADGKLLEQRGRHHAQRHGGAADAARLDDAHKIT
ncbi:hypothetical protein AD428_01205 [Achromobacter sp. DMS1]|nr:hypothetical protein AD428_01205 [Achromobacter sp. DMS1]